VLGAVERVVWTHWSAGSRVPLRPYGWLFDRRAGGGWLGAWGSHAVDALRGWFGELEVVTAELTTTITSRPDRDGRPQACDADDGMSVTLRTAAGVLIVIDSTFAAPATLAPRLVIVGSAAIVEVVADRRVVLHRADGTRDEWTAAADGDAHLAPMRAWATVVRATVRGEAHPEGAATFADGLAVRTLLDRIVEAAGR
jgi:predicted dehydrogenase